MRAMFLVLALAGASAAADLPSGKQIVEDATGRRVTLPPASSIRKVYPAGPPAAVLIATLAPEKLAGWTLALDENQRAFLPASVRGLPRVGRLSGKGSTANVEEVLKSGVDVVLDIGTVVGSSHALAKDTADRTGLPTLLMDGTFDKLPATYRTLGRVLGVEARGEALASYVDRQLSEIRDGLAKVPAGPRTKVYYGRGPKALDTAVAGSVNAESLERAGADNVAKAAGPRGSVVPVSPEDLIAWNPDVILTIEATATEHVKTDPVFRTLGAVKAGRVYQSPNRPFGWIDYPPSINRLLGAFWLTRMLHPTVFKDDLAAKVAEFHKVVYQRELAPDELAELLKGLATKP